MKRLFTILLFVLSAVAVQAQDTPEVPTAAKETKETKAAMDAKKVVSVREAKVYTELMAGSEKIVKGAPFSAEAVNESIQTLADGNRIVHNSSTKMYRDGEGRFRREGGASSGALFAPYTGFSSATITDPVLGFRYVINDKDKTVRKSPFKAFGPLKTGNFEMALTQKLHTELNGTYTTTIKATPEAKAELEKALQGKAVIVAAHPGQPVQAGQMAPLEAMPGKMTIATTVQGMVGGPGQMIFHSSGEESASGMTAETKNESLGMKDFDGIQAEGTRTVTTMPAGMIGNERPIEIVYERWYSKDLQMTVYSRHSDPRFGEQIYRLTNINRNEPDPSVFAVPADYKVQAEIGFSTAPVYKIAGVPSVTMTAPGAPATIVTVPAPAKAPTAPKKDQ
jgi:biotin carboxyl carrier protein